MALIPPDFLDCVTAIGIEQKGEKQWIGTGFLFGDFVEKKDEKTNNYRTYIVTNKHVIKDLDSIFVRFNPQGGQQSKDYKIDLKVGDDYKWTGHPDSNVDVAVIQVNVGILSQEGILFKFLHSDSQTADIQKMTSIGVTEGDSVFVLGFPMGLVQQRQYAIVRKGCIARVRDLLEKNSNEIILDSLVFPGNSGGPVFLAPELSHIAGTKGNNQCFLIGIIKQYLPYTDVAVSLQTKRPRITFEENSGLSVAEPVDKITETIKADLEKKKVKETEKEKEAEKANAPQQ